MCARKEVHFNFSCFILGACFSFTDLLIEWGFLEGETMDLRNALSYGVIGY